MAAGTVIALLAPAGAGATTITVNTTADEYGGSPKCSLRDAVESVDDTANFGGCTRVGSGADVIRLTPGATYLRTIDGPSVEGGTLYITRPVTIEPSGKGVSTISGNSTLERQGNFYVTMNGSLTINRLTVTKGASAFGAGIYVTYGTLHVNQSTIRDNHASDPNGYGGGIYNYGGTATITNSTIAGNTATQQGGGLENQNGPVLVRNSTITGNIASGVGGGGGLSDYTSVAAPPFTTLTNTIMAANSGASAPDCGQGNLGTAAFVSQGYNLIGDDTGCTFTAAAGDKKNVSPGLAAFDPSSGTYPLLSGSAALNAGDPATPGASPHCSAIDQRGVSRPQFGRCDIGAYELAPKPKQKCTKKHKKKHRKRSASAAKHKKKSKCGKHKKKKHKKRK